MIDKNTIVSDADRPNDRDALTVLDKFAGIISKSRRNSNSADELIGSLSEAYENRRARQVFEWEKARRGRLMEI